MKVSEGPSQEEQGIHPKLTNPLSEETRKERVYLLGTSAIGITIVFIGLIPTEVATLGIKFAEADRKSLLIIFALVVSYFLVAFGSYALSDFLLWREAERDSSLREQRRLLKRTSSEIEQEIEQELNLAKQDEVELLTSATDRQARREKRLRNIAALEKAITERHATPFIWTRPIISIRFAFEFIVPFAVGIFAIVALVIRAGVLIEGLRNV